MLVDFPGHMVLRGCLCVMDAFSALLSFRTLLDQRTVLPPLSPDADKELGRERRTAGVYVTQLGYSQVLRRLLILVGFHIKTGVHTQEGPGDSEHQLLTEHLKG